MTVSCIADAKPVQRLGFCESDRWPRHCVTRRGGASALPSPLEETTMRTIASLAVALAALWAMPASAQMRGYPGTADRTAFTVEPYVGYGFYGTLPDGGPKLGADAAYGVKGSLLLSPQLALTGTFQQSNPR